MTLKQKVFNYSMKNCPIPHPDSYQKCLINKTEHFLKRLRWRTHFHLKELENDNSSHSDNETRPSNHFGFPSPKSPPTITELAGFEADLWRLVDSVTFTKHKSKFQKQFLMTYGIFETVKI